MPIYEYICLDCGNRFEELRPMKDADAPVDCEQCESEHTSRMLGGILRSQLRAHDRRRFAGLCRLPRRKLRRLRSLSQASHLRT